MKMKKFFGLKMTLAALAVVSFASCYDSESGDVIIPSQTSVDWPAPVYTVMGHVTDMNGAVADVDIAGAGLVGMKTDLNGDFSANLAAPINGEVSFTKDGYFRTTRTLKMPTLKTGTAVFNLDAVMYTLDDPAGALKEKDVETNPVEAKAVTVPAADVAAATGINFTNTTDNPVLYDFWASVLTEKLPYGVKAVAAKSLEEDGQLAFLTWFNQSKFSWYQESPYGDYGKYDGRLTVSIPANFQVTKIKAIPWLTEMTMIFPLAEGDFEQPVEIYDTYTVEVEGIPLDHDHGHGHGNNTNAGGGAGGE
jgi:hypothetical protein